MSKGGTPMDVWSGAYATKELHAAIERYQEQSSRQTQQVLRLTWVIAILTFVMTVAVGFQIYLTFFPPR